MPKKPTYDSFTLDRRQLERAITLFDRDCAKDFKLLGLDNRLSRAVYWVAKELMCLSTIFVELIAAALFVMGFVAVVGIYQWAVHGNPPSMMEVLIIITLGPTLASVLRGGLVYIGTPITSVPMDTLVSNAPTKFSEVLRSKAGEGHPLSSLDVHNLADVVSRELNLQVALDLQMVALEKVYRPALNQHAEAIEDIHRAKGQAGDMTSTRKS